MKANRSVVAFILFALTVVLLFWLGGYDFDQRGEKAVMCGVLAITAGCMGFSLSEVFR